MSALTIYDNWGYLEYSFNGVRIDSTVPGYVEVEWPDHELERLRYYAKPCTRQAEGGSQGSVWPVETHELCVTVLNRGVELEVPLRRLNVVSIEPDPSVTKAVESSVHCLGIVTGNSHFGYFRKPQ